MRPHKPIVPLSTVILVASLVNIIFVARIAVNPKHVVLLLAAVFFLNSVNLIAMVYEITRNHHQNKGQ
jgi:NADH:ubiquinone oxidoreductase subunit K